MNKKEYTSPYCVVHSLCEEVVLLAGTGNNPHQPSTPTLPVDNGSGKEIEKSYCKSKNQEINRGGSHEVIPLFLSCKNKRKAILTIY